MLRMKRMMTALPVVALAGAAQAQEADWTFTLSPYIWTPGAATSVDTRFGTLDAEAGIDDVLSATEFALMGLFEARRGRWGLIADLVYSDLSESRDTPFGKLFSQATVETELVAASAYVAYRFQENDRTAADVMAGVRSISLDLDVGLDPGLLPPRSFDLGESWVDPVVGGRFRVALSDRWFAAVLADFGGSGGGSDRTWQAVGTLGYQISDRWSVQGGWRRLSIEKEIEGRDVDLELDGPLLGLTARF